MIRVGIVGGAGYTGAELLRLLCRHPQVELCCVTSRTESGRRIDQVFPNLRGHVDLEFVDPDSEELNHCDLIYFATPNGVAMQHVPRLMQKGIRIIDLSADFRLTDPLVWQQWYQQAHVCPELLSQAVYGLPELHRTTITQAQLIANPGCYPTAVQLGFLPLLSAGCVDDQHLIADVKSGVSGAGRGAKTANLYAEVSGNFKAYSVPGHRHLPEITQSLGRIAQQDVGLTFVPHLLPMVRGIHATLYAQLNQTVDLQALFEQQYKDELFVDVLPAASHPETHSVRGSNMCQIAVHQPSASQVVVLAVIDNLVKGAAGQAVQNMNIMFGYEEQLGLDMPAMLP